MKGQKVLSLLPDYISSKICILPNEASLLLGEYSSSNIEICHVGEGADQDEDFCRIDVETFVARHLPKELQNADGVRRLLIEIIDQQITYPESEANQDDDVLAEFVMGNLLENLREFREKLVRA